MQASSPFLSDTEYNNLWSSLQQNDNHVCTRQCEFKQVFGNMWYCVSSGQAHVCDQNCGQRIFRDNFSDICRLSRRVFARSSSSSGEAPMADMARKRSGEEHASLLAAKRPQSGDLQQQAAQYHHQQQQQAHILQQHQQQAPQGWPANC